MTHAFGNAPTGMMQPPEVRLPDHDHFARRARRLRELADRVAPLGDFLRFMAQLAQAQQVALERAAPAWQPEPQAFALALAHGMPPLNVQALRETIDLAAELDALLGALELHVGEAQRPLLDALRRRPPEEIERLADDVLAGAAGDERTRGLMPLVAAALQVVWLRLARTLPEAPARPAGEARTLCPSCGSPPLASVIEADPRYNGVRYLQCGLCATQWYLERSICSVCEQSGRLDYFSLTQESDEAAPLPAQAEACGDCGSYLKVFVRELDAGAEPLADDLASLALDLLLGEEGRYRRSGANPLLIVE
ncbi:MULTISPECIES: formate dehydrogenase accessory protein FdhE [unclassified Halomonas]|uniref:formate dehydrogenase accessory protein FdhE n=1 Tax=unclassified Halomonas TaxID=2609666 RepID=UPI0018D21607|nr:formate dehydrogenase accessory protein FdhE [Halomonas sp. SS10-MC5]QPP49454.1 formate dehydrogenase accessory protein FdhE [Halomonas sp. SS10-MC5]